MADAAKTPSPSLRVTYEGFLFIVTRETLGALCTDIRDRRKRMAAAHQLQQTAFKSIDYRQIDPVRTGMSADRRAVTVPAGTIIACEEPIAHQLHQSAARVQICEKAARIDRHGCRR